MVLDKRIHGVCVSQEIRELIQKGFFGINYDEDVEKRIQPAGFDPYYENFAFRVPHGFRPFQKRTVEESLRIKPKNEVVRYEDISNGLDIRPEFSYLLKLKGKFLLPDGFFLKSSPKSTQGRLGNLVRLLADESTDYDEIVNLSEREKDLWVLVEPIAFPLKIHPDSSLNQLRIFSGKDYEVNDDELRRELSLEELVYLDDKPAKHDQLVINKGLVLRADLLGRKTDELIGFKSLKNPDPIDIKKIRELDWESYFEPILSPDDGVLKIYTEDKLVLLSSLERVRTPPKMSSYISEYTAQFGEFRSHAAGFIDPNFRYPKEDIMGASVVLEIFTKENGVLRLRHEDNCARMIYEKLRKVPDKLYGAQLGSSYQKQLGAWLPKPFKLPESEVIVSAINKNQELIMTVPAHQLFELDYFQGFRRMSEIDYESRIRQNATFIKRREAETNPRFKQLIPYAIIYNPSTKKIFAYQRAVDPKNYQEARLRGKWSIGVGGHIRITDKSGNPILLCLDRELREEIQIKNVISRELKGYLNYDTDEVGTVHFGLVYIIETNEEEIRPKDNELLEGRMMAVEKIKLIRADSSYLTETWTQIVLDNLEKIIG